MGNISMLAMLLFFTTAALFGYLLRYILDAYWLKKQQLLYNNSSVNTNKSTSTTAAFVNKGVTVENKVVSNALVDADGIIYRLECENNDLKKRIKQVAQETIVENNTNHNQEELQQLKITVKDLLQQKESLMEKNEYLLNTVTSLESQFRDLFEKSSSTQSNSKQLESRLAASEAALEEQVKINAMLKKQTDELYGKLEKKESEEKENVAVGTTSLLQGIGNLHDPVQNISGNIKEQMTRLHEAEKTQEEKPVRATVIKNRTNQLTDTKQASEVLGTKVKWNDLKLVEGIGPKIEELFHKAGITTWEELSETSIERCREILQKGGERFQMHNPTTWPKQCKLLAAGKWKQLKEYQLSLNGGRVVEK